MIVLDTNIVSELMKSDPDKGVWEFVDNNPASAFFITAITQAEIAYGIKLLEEGKKKKNLTNIYHKLIQENFFNKILPFDSYTTDFYAQICFDRKQQGKPISQFDAQIAAICASRRTALATRNIKDFEGCDIKLINPFKG